MSVPYMFREKLEIEPGFNPWDVIGPDNPVLQPLNPTPTTPPTPTKTITGATTTRDDAGNLIQNITYSD